MIADLYNMFLKCSGVSIDSRTIEEGELFFALSGPNFDGHQYVDSAFEKGAKYAVIDNEAFENDRTFRVKNVEKALQDLARYHRLYLDIPFVGLTGSNGKTTTKELMHSVLNQRFKVFATKGNLNNHLGVPLSVLSVTKEHEVAIIEMGANHIGEIAFLCEMSMPDYGYITNIGKAHLEGFGSLDGVKKGKTELFDYIEKVQGTIIYDVADQTIVDAVDNRKCNKIDFDSRELNVMSSFPTLTYEMGGETVLSNLSGLYNVRNIAAAISIGDVFNVKRDNIFIGIENYQPRNNRSQIVKTEKNHLIMDAYNANPESMKVSIDNLANANECNKVLLLGKMLELGDFEREEHQNLVDHISKYSWENVFLVGEQFSGLDCCGRYTIFTNREKASEYFKVNPLEGCFILIKGSRGAALEKLVPYL